MFDLMLPAIGPKGRPYDINLVLLLRGDQEVGIHGATVEQGRPWQQIPGCSVVFDRRSHHTIRRGGRGGEDLRDQSGVLGLTGLCEVELRAHPMGACRVYCRSGRRGRRAT